LYLCSLVLKIKIYKSLILKSMPVRIRLARHGKKGFAFYHIVAADSRAPRDGRYIERLGVYNPNTHPASVELNFDKALDWLQKGAQPSDTCRSILSEKGVLMKKHLLEGVAKNAFTLEVAEQKFESWMKEKEARVVSEKEQLKKSKEDDKKKRHEAEAKVKEAKAQAIAKKLAQSAVAANEAAAEEAAAPAENE
jgi:small subunit ribosomal protein S16